MTNNYKMLKTKYAKDQSQIYFKKTLNNRNKNLNSFYKIIEII